MIKETILFGLCGVNDNKIEFKDEKEIAFNKDQLEMLLFRFSPDAFIVDEYKFMFRDRAHLIIKNEDNTFLVTNLEQVYNEAYIAYKKLNYMDMTYKIVSFDYEAANDALFTIESVEIKDEFNE